MSAPGGSEGSGSGKAAEPKGGDGGKVAGTAAPTGFLKTFSALKQTPRVVALVWRAWPIGAVVILAMTLAGAPLPALGLVFFKKLIDGMGVWLSGDAAAGRPTVVLSLCVMAGLQLVGRVISSLDHLLRRLMERKLQLSIQNRLFVHAQSLDVGHFETPSFHDKLSRVREECGYRPFNVTYALISMARETTTVASLLVLLVDLSWWTLPLMLCVTLPGLLLRAKFGHLGWFITYHRMPGARRMWYYERTLTSRDQAKEIRIFGLSAHLLSKWREYFWQFYREDRRLWLKRNGTELADQLLRQAGYLGFYAYVIWRITRVPRGTVGDLVMYTQAMERSIGGVSNILESISVIYENNLYMNSLFEYLQIKPAVSAPPQPVPVPKPVRTGIRIEGLSFSYPQGGTKVLDGLSLDIRAGERVALVGENGAGKTTLVKLLARLYDPQEGRITVDGVDLRQMDPAQWAKQIGVIFQDYAKWTVSARENIGFGQLEYIDDLPRIKAAAVLSDTAQRIERMPKGYDTLLGKEFDEGEELSGGEWQKVALARAFIREAQVLVLDEPTASLDAKQEYLMYRQFNELTAGRTTILISHRFSTVRMVDRIFVIEHGKVVECGSHSELMQLEGRYAELFSRQASAYV